MSDNKISGKARGHIMLSLDGHAESLDNTRSQAPSGIKRPTLLIPRLHGRCCIWCLALESRRSRTVDDFAPSLKEPPFPVTHEPAQPRHGQIFHSSHAGGFHIPLCFHSDRFEFIHPSTSSTTKRKENKRENKQLDGSRKWAVTNLSGAFILSACKNYY